MLKFVWILLVLSCVTSIYADENDADKEGETDIEVVKGQLKNVVSLLEDLKAVVNEHLDATRNNGEILLTKKDEPSLLKTLQNQQQQVQEDIKNKFIDLNVEMKDKFTALNDRIKENFTSLNEYVRNKFSEQNQIFKTLSNSVTKAVEFTTQRAAVEKFRKKYALPGDTEVMNKACRVSDVTAVSVVSALLKLGVSPDVLYDNKTCLHWAADKNHVEIARLMLEHGANINKRVDYGWTPLTSASYLGSLEAVKLLVKYGADLTLKTGDKTALGWAINGGKLNIVNYLRSIKAPY